MKVDGKHYRTVWVSEDDESGRTINIIDQRHLPHSFVIESIKTAEGMATAIRDMHVRGAGCIGACAAAGMWLAAVQAPRSPPSEFDKHMETSSEMLMATRPTAVNLEHAVQKCLASMRACGEDADWEAKMLVCWVELCCRCRHWEGFPWLEGSDLTQCNSVLVGLLQDNVKSCG